MSTTDCFLRLLVRHSGSSSDEPLARQLLDHLRPLQRIGVVDVWSDDRIRAGDEPRRELERAIETADVALLLVSSDFLTSDFIQEVELPLLRARHKEGKLSIVPILLRACTWDFHPWLGEFRALPRSGKAIGSVAVDARDEMWTEIVREIRGFSAAPLKETNPDPYSCGPQVETTFDGTQSTEFLGGTHAGRPLHENSKSNEEVWPAPNPWSASSPRSAPSPRPTSKRSYLWVVPVVAIWAIFFLIIVGIVTSASDVGDPEQKLAELTAELDRQTNHDADTGIIRSPDGSLLLPENETEYPPPLEEVDPNWAQGVIVFYDGIRASGNMLGMVTDNAGQRNQLDKNEPIRDNKAKSCILRSVREGAVISVFDSPQGDRSDDWTVITVKKTHPQYVIITLESNIDDDYVQVKHMRKNGLNGNVSRIDVD